MTQGHPSSWLLAVKSQSPYLAFAVLDAERAVEVACHYFTRRRYTSEQLRGHFLKFVRDYAPGRIVTEPDEVLYRAAVSTGYPVQTLTLASAKEILLPSEEHPRNRDLYRLLVARYPELSRLVSILPHSGKVVEWEPWRTVQLLAVGLGLAAQRLPLCAPSSAPTPPPTLIYP